MAEKTPNQQLAEKLLFKPAYVGDKSAAVKQEAHAFAEGYKKFLDAGKTEREVAAESEQMLKDAGYQQFDPKKTYAPGDKVYFSQLGKAIVASTIGTRSFEDGFHLCYRVFAVVIIPRFLVLAVSPGDIAVHTLSAAWAFQNAGQDVCMIWIVDLFPLKGIDLTLFLCQIPIFFRNDGFVLSLINRELRLLNYVHLISCALLLFRPASAIGDLSHVNGIVQYILHEVP